MHVSELFDPSILDSHVQEGLVLASRNNDDNLTIYNYSPIVQTRRLWDDVTKACRGLILDDEGTVVARPFPKFFNYSETDMYEEEISPDTPVTAYDKLDGSLGIVYWDKNGQARVATRGSFHSAQAEHASERIKDLLIPNFSNITILVEIIYPENQIVVDYRGVDDLFLLGGVDINYGTFIDPVDLFTEIRGVYPHGGFKYLVQGYNEIKTVGDALNNLNRTNREGFVLHTEDGTMVKVKQDDYIAMHRAVFNTSKRDIWYSFVNDVVTQTGRPLEELATRRIKNNLDAIKSAGTSDEYLEKLIPLLPENLAVEAKKAREELVDKFQAQLHDLQSILMSLDGVDKPRAEIYQLALEHAGKTFAGIVTNIVCRDDEEVDDSQIDRLAMSVVESLMPKKGDRLTAELTEEEE